MHSITYQLITVFCFIDDYLKSHPNQRNWRTSRHKNPAFSDAEVLTIALIQGSFGCASLKQTHRLVANNYKHLFPRLPSYKQWMARLHRLTALVGLLMRHIPHHQEDTGLYLFDSKPIPVCKPIRHGRVRLLRDQGAYFGKNKAGWYFGFKLHLVAHGDGTILSAFLTPANFDDRSVAPALAEALEGGVVLADVGYRDEKELEDALLDEWGVILVTPAHAGAVGSLRRILVSSLRERVETCFSSLWHRFVDRVFSRSWEGLWNTIKLKMFHYNLCKAGILQP